MFRFSLCSSLTTFEPSHEQGEGADATQVRRVGRAGIAEAEDIRECLGGDDIPQPPPVHVIVYQPLAQAESGHLPCCDFVINT